MEREYDCKPEINNSATTESTALNILGLEAMNNSGSENMNETNHNDSQDTDIESLGEAWLDENETIWMHLRRTADGQNADAMFSYPKSDPYYPEILKHLNGLKHGERKPVPPWK